MTSYTPNLDLAKQDTGAQGWGTVLNQNFDKIDAGYSQIGVKNYSSMETYAAGEFVIAVVDDQVGIYKSLQGGNTGHSLTDTTWWEAVPLGGGGAPRNVGEKIISTIPLEDAGLHLLDGSLIQGGGAYDDFVSYMADLYDNTSLDKKVYNVNVVGSLVNTDGVLSGFSASDYVELPENFDGSTPWERVLKFTTGNFITNQVIWGNNGDYRGFQVYIRTDGKFTMSGSSNNSTWNLFDVTSTTVLTADTTYYLRVIYDGNKYTQEISTDGVNYNLEGTANVATPVTTTTIRLGTHGGAPFSGTIDLNESYIKINGDFWWQGVTYENEIFCSESDWFRSVNLYGSCSKFVYDEVNNTVRLPKRTSEHGELIKSYSNGTEWYRIYEDGWCEQGGLNLTSQSSGNNSGYAISIPLLVEMADNNYIGFLQASFGGGSSWNGPYKNETSSTTSTAVFSGWVTGSCTVICRSWIVCGYVDISGYQYSPLYEYICIATITNTQVEIDINQVMTDVNAKVDKGDLTPCHVVVETYVNGTSWYRLYDDGWCEQGQRIEESGVNAVDIYFIKEYASVPDLLTSVCSTNRSTYLDNNIDVRNLTASGFTKQYIANVGTGWSWEAKGYIAQENE